VIEKGKLPSNHSSLSVGLDSVVLGTVNGSDIAFLQYTSGSTSEPKGVMITHDNLTHNMALISKAIGSNTETVNISWLPQYHDVRIFGLAIQLIFFEKEINYYYYLFFIDGINWCEP
jgi:long-subunit acyl-CoA synthetase (AMP-forming)